MKSHYEAISFYTDTINNTKGFLDFQLDEKKTVSRKTEPSTVINDLFQNINQCYIAKAFAQEKMSFSGFDLNRAKHNLESFIKLLYKVNSKIDCNSYLIIANYFLNLGNLFYYKNSKVSPDDIVLLFGENPLFSSEDLILIMRKLGAWREDIDNHKVSSISWENNHYKRHDELEDLISSIRENRCENRYTKKILASLLSNIGNVLTHICSNSFTRSYDMKFDSPSASLLYYILSLMCVDRYHAYDDNSEKDIYEFFKLNSDEREMKAFEGITKEAWEMSFTYSAHLSESLKPIGNYLKQAEGFFKKLKTNPQFGKLVFINVPQQLSGKTIDDVFSPSIGNVIRADIGSILCLYSMSYEMYLESGVKISATFQLRKMLYLIRSILTKKSINRGDVLGDGLSKAVFDNIINRLNKLNSEISDIADKKQYLKYIKTIDPDFEKVRSEDFKAIKEQIDDSLSNHPDDREVWLLYSHIKLTIDENTDCSELSKINSENAIATQYGRIGELLFEERRQSIILKQQVKEMKENGEMKIVLIGKKDTLQQSIVDRLFACLSIVRISDSLRTNSMISFSLIGFTYFKIGKTLSKFFPLLSKDERKSVIASLQKHLKTELYTLNDHCFYYKKAVLLYEKSRSLHSQGKEYQRKISNMIFLEDDFNDNSNHFGIALDRYYLFSGNIDSHIRDAEKIIKKDENRVKRGICLK